MSLSLRANNSITILHEIEKLSEQNDYKSISKKISELDNEIYYLRRANEHGIQRQKRQTARKASELNVLEINALNKINNLCHAIEENILDTYENSLKQATSWLGQQNITHPRDHEIEIIIVCYLGEDDPEYDEDEDNIIADLKHLVSIDSLKDNYDYSHINLKLDQNHSYVFHSLYDHTTPRLTWEDILRIKSIWVDVQTWLQCEYRI